MTNLVQFPGLGLSFELDRVAFSIGGMNIYWYGVCIAVGMCLALVFAAAGATSSIRRPLAATPLCPGACTARRPTIT